MGPFFIDRTFKFMYICCMENCKFRLDFVDFKLDANTIPELVNLYFENFDKTYGEIYAKFEWYNEFNTYRLMNADDWNLYTKLFTYKMKKRSMEKDFI